MDKLREFLLPRKQAQEETMLDQAVRRELERRNLMKAVCRSHPAESEVAPVRLQLPKKHVH